MPTSFAKIEKAVFRRVNAIVEPAVRKGIGSPTLAPAGLILLETTDFKSGQQRNTPLWSFRLGRYRVVSTARGDRSFWVKNLKKEPKVAYYLGGKRRESNAVVIAGDAPKKGTLELSPAMQKLSEVLSRLGKKGWTFAILAPIKK